MNASVSNIIFNCNMYITIKRRHVLDTCRSMLSKWNLGTNIRHLFSKGLIGFFLFFFSKMYRYMYYNFIHHKQDFRTSTLFRGWLGFFILFFLLYNGCVTILHNRNETSEPGSSYSQKRLCYPLDKLSINPGDNCW